MKTLEGKVAVITGASRGLGKAIATLFARQGAMVVLSARSKIDIEQNAADMRAEGLEASAIVCDVSDPQQVDSLARFTIQKYGDFDIWVNNAGSAGPYGATLDLSPDQFLSVLRTNMFGVYYGSQIAMRHFLPQVRQTHQYPGSGVEETGTESKRIRINQGLDQGLHPGAGS
jgi:NAD(P)-dependent dehydrogenase (short-subunit alcohol dehydrogenase family)